MSEQNTEVLDIESAAHRITYHSKTRIGDFRSLPLSIRSAVFNILSPSLRQEILDSLYFPEVVELLDHLDPRRVHHILSRMKDKKRRERLIGRIKSERYEKIEYFLSFHPQAKPSLFHLNYVYLPEETTIGETAVIIEDHIKNTGKIPVILVSKEGEFVGEVTLGTLVREKNTSKLRNYITDTKKIPYNADKAEVMSIFTSNPHEKVIVTDSDGSVLGVVYSDDVLDLLEDQPAVSLYNFAGVESSERPFDSVQDKVSGRYRWLIINLATCFLAAGVVAMFDETINQLVIFAVFMPIVAGMGSNAGTQTLAVMVRGIAVGEITLKNGWPAVRKEILAAVVNGLITGGILIPIAMLLGVGFWISLLGAAAVVFVLVVGGLFGSVVPLVLKRFGKDPATSASILITTVTDVFGFLFLLGLAKLFFL